VPPAQVIVSAGGKQAIFHALLATLNAGDEVLIPAPWWVSYPEIVRFAGADVVALPTDAAGGFRITAVQLDAAITPRTRWLLLNSPGNPTGATYPAEELRSIGEVLRRHPHVLVMSDDIYAPLRYTPGSHATLAVECPDLAERVLTVSGVSKSHAMTGFRIGVSAGPLWLISAMARLQSHSSGNAASISQAAAVAAFEGPQDFLVDWREKFRVRRDLCVAALNAIPDLRHLIIETSFDNALADIAQDSQHHWPDSLAADLHNLGVRPEVWITHLKPGNEAAIMDELRAAAPGWTLGVLQQGQVIELVG